MRIGKSDIFRGEKDTRSVAPQIIRICLLAYPGSQAAAILGLTDLLAVADRVICRQQGATHARLVTYQARLDQGEHAFGREGLAEPHPAAPDVIVIPPSLEDPLSAVHPRALLEFIMNGHASGACVAAVCSGGFLLAATGLLDRRIAAMHPMYGQSFEERFPGVVIDYSHPVIDHGDMTTSAGMLAWIDIGLVLVERFLGREVAEETAAFFHVQPPAAGRAALPARLPSTTHGDKAIISVQQWLTRVGTCDVTNAAMAAQAGLQVRTFQRRFINATGMSPADYRQHLRVTEAAVLLERTTQPVDAIAWTVGYQDASSFRKVFRRITGISPGAYRRQVRTG